MKNYLFVLFLLLTIGTYAQNIQGKVVDESTGTAIPYVSLSINGTSIATLTNENGEFIIKSPTLPFKLKGSHVSYITSETIVLQQDNNFIIRLKPAVINLLEVSVDPNKGLKLLQDALNKATINQQKTHYLNTFYRQLTTVNNTAAEIHEIFYDLKWNPIGTNGWLVQQTRFAEKRDKIGPDLNNQSYFTFISNGYLAQNKNSAFINLKNLNSYIIDIDSYIEQTDQDIAVITCKLRNPKKGQYYANSKYFIGVNDHKIYRLEHNIYSLPMTLNGGITFKFPSIVQTVATYKDSGDEVTVLESSAVKMYLSIQYRSYSNIQDVMISVNSLLSVIKEDEKLNTLNFNQVRRDIKDKNVIESVKYNADFWRNNPIVKQTALEDKFIKMMEGQNAFGTMTNH